MISEITLYTRLECCLCEEMKEVVRRVAGEFSLSVNETDVDTSDELRRLYGSEVPVLFINGRKAFKYRVTAADLKERLRREAHPIRKV
ncbi:MAG: glutaredoxin family protein [Deltaproteobacteria bacterium]|nr:glutaredoxin family protein [Deltaproteobacteria bacterium]MBI2991351.1 glutaredoxin family protein [Deltaproteobacteria bacterium]MBI3063112.1 glutaredoxin family protein [Deltaproteobacteria bacterium]